MADYQPTSGRSLSLPCIVCGEPFTFTTKAKGRYPRFCSDLCRIGRARREIEPKECATCGEAFLPQRITRTAKSHGLYCSLACRPQSHPIEVHELEAHERGHHQRRRARMKMAPDIERVDDREIFNRDGWVCRICDKPVDPAVKWPRHETVCLNHIVPLSKGGQHASSNLQCAHWICSSRRGDRATS